MEAGRTAAGFLRSHVRSASVALAARLSNDLLEMRAAGTFKMERVITGPMESVVTVAGSVQPVLNFCANNYLGLSNHPRLVEAAARCLRTHGLGASSVRFICGTTDLHKKLEAAISSFHGTEDAILFPSCFDANAGLYVGLESTAPTTTRHTSDPARAAAARDRAGAPARSRPAHSRASSRVRTGLFEAILGPEDVVISDALNHASIIDGIRLCKASRERCARGMRARWRGCPLGASLSEPRRNPRQRAPP